MSRATTGLTRLGEDRRGGAAVVFAVLLPVLVMIAGGAIDFAEIVRQRSRLQDVVDGAALAAARELGLSDARRESVPAVVAAVVRRAVGANDDAGLMPSLTTLVSTSPLEVVVKAAQPTRPYFGGGFGLLPDAVEVEAVAQIVGRPNICLLGLDPSATGTISLEKNARLTGENCAIYSNSTATNSIKSKNSAVLVASLICTAGGKDGSKGNFMPDPLVDCPTFDDPLAARPEPQVAACDASMPRSVSASTRLRPGTYCGGLTLTAGADVVLDPGIYVIKDGPLTVADGARLAGAGVGFFFTGSGAVLTFARASSIDLAAARDGATAGLLLFEGRQQPTSGVHQILSDDARNLLGTIYLPRGRLHVDANSPIADKSAYTAIVARMVTLYGGPHLVLNTNYSATDVPVPEGIKGAGQPVKLVK